MAFAILPGGIGFVWTVSSSVNFHRDQIFTNKSDHVPHLCLFFVPCSFSVCYCIHPNSLTMFTKSAAAVSQFSATNPVSLLGNVDIRSLSTGSSSLTEASGEDEDEQNCPPYSSGTCLIEPILNSDRTFH